MIKKIIVFALTLGVICSCILAGTPNTVEAAVDKGVAIDSTNFPDGKFREYIEKNFDKNRDRYLSEDECSDVNEISVPGKKIKSLKGIENFEQLSVLYCQNNKIEDLDLSKNEWLVKLRCEGNNFTTLDISNCYDLVTCYVEGHESLGINYLQYKMNGDFDDGLLCVDKGVKVQLLKPSYKMVVSQNGVIGKSISLSLTEGKWTSSNPAVASVDKDFIVTAHKTGITNITVKVGNKSSKCKVTVVKAKKKSKGEIAINEKNFPDPGFRDYLFNEVDENSNGYLSPSEIKNTKTINLFGSTGGDMFYYYDYSVTDFKGLEFLTEVDYLDINVLPDNYLLDVSQNKKITKVEMNSIGKPCIITLRSGQKLCLGADYEGDGGNPNIKSSDPGVAKVEFPANDDNAVFITAKKAGKANLTVKIAEYPDDYDGTQKPKIINHECDVIVRYKDVVDTSKFWFEPTYALSAMDIVKGYKGQTTFRPSAKCTRAQMVTFLWRMEGTPSPKSKTCKFKDVKKSDYFYEAVLWAEEQGITTGYKGGKFKPQNVCTRAQAVTFLWRLAGSPAPKDSDNKFKDVTKSDYFYNAVLWASENKIVAGYKDNTFKPDGKCLRRQMVTFLYKFHMCNILG